MPNYKAELVGVFGHPVSENPTVVVQEAAFQALNLNWRYLTIEVLPEQLGDAIRGLRAFNMRGINLTIPHKIEVMQFLAETGKALREMPGFSGGGSGGGSPNLTANEAKMMINEKKADQEFMKKYMAGDKASVAEMQRLNNFAFPEPKKG